MCCGEEGDIPVASAPLGRSPGDWERCARLSMGKAPASKRGHRLAQGEDYLARPALGKALGDRGPVQLMARAKPTPDAFGVRLDKEAASIEVGRQLVGGGARRRALSDQAEMGRGEVVGEFPGVQELAVDETGNRVSMSLAWGPKPAFHRSGVFAPDRGDHPIDEVRQVGEQLPDRRSRPVGRSPPVPTDGRRRPRSRRGTGGSRLAARFILGRETGPNEKDARQRRRLSISRRYGFDPVADCGRNRLTELRCLERVHRRAGADALSGRSLEPESLGEESLSKDGADLLVAHRRHPSHRVPYFFLPFPLLLQLLAIFGRMCTESPFCH